MKAPDKIYCGDNGHGNLSFSTNKVYNTMYEYIRKDTLLEWAKEMKRICKGAEPIEKTYQTVIDKIESL